MSLLCVCLALATATPHLHLLPQPRQMEATYGPLQLSGHVTVYLPKSLLHDDGARFAADQLVAALHTAGLDASFRAALPTGPGAWLALGIPDRDKGFAALAKAHALKLTDAMAAEGYALSAEPGGLVLAAASPTGLFYGVQTIRQLLRRRVAHRAEIPGVRIEDWPVMHLRGIMDDTSRGQVPTVATARRMVDFCAYYKLNFYGPYIEQTFAWKGHKDIWQGSGAWSPRDFTELCEYAHKRHVMVIPQFEAMGHQTHILSKPAYKALAETHNGWSFAPANPGTYKLMDDLMGQMSRAFPYSPFFGIGCDEVFDMGKGQSKALTEKLGGVGQLFAYYIKHLDGILSRYGREPMMWGDMMLNHPETMGLVPKNVLILDWHYGAAPSYPSVKQFRDAGYQVVVCPALSSWVRIFPDYTNAFVNIQNLTADGQKYGAMGSMTCNWGDWGAENLVDYNWMGWAWSAACAWDDAASVDQHRFNRDFAQTFYGTRDSLLADAQWDLADGNSAFSWGQSPLAYFHANPFKLAEPMARRTKALAALTDKAAGLLDEEDKRVTRNRDTLPYLRQPVERYEYVVRRATDMPKAAEAYTDAANATDSGVRRADLEKCRDLLRGLREDLVGVREDFRKLWLASSRPEGLDFDLGKFDAQIKDYDTHIAAVEAALKTGKLEPPGKLGLQARNVLVGTPVARADLKATGAWGSGNWQHGTLRAALRIEAGKADRPAGTPMLLALNLSKLGGEPVEPASPWVVFDGHATPAQTVPLWTTDGPEANAALTFLLPVDLPAGKTFDATLYWAPKGDAGLAHAYPAHLSDLHVETKPGQVWIENSQLRVMIGSEGAHVYVWQVKALGNRDVTSPGTSDWSGFLDWNWARTTHFALKVLASGPVAAVVHAVSPDGAERLITVWAGLPIVDLVGDPTTWFWDYDNVANFAADQAMPGRGRFGDGTDEAVPAAAERIHLLPKHPVWWCAKYRPDGLTLGLITPAAPTPMMIGPGGGWGGVGMDNCPATQRFITYCDVTPDKWQAVAKLAGALRADRPLKVEVGPAEKR